MKRLLVLFMALSVVAFGSTFARGQDLLTNGNLNELDSDANPDPGLYYDMPVAWLIETDPCSFSPCAIVRYPGYPAGFAEHTAPGAPNTNGIVFNSTEGDFPGFPDVLFVDAHLTQSVAATEGQKYKMSGWAYFEGGFAGGVETIDPNSGASRAGLPSLTDVFFALEFLDGGNNVLPGSISEVPGIDNGYELYANGQVNNPDSTEVTKNWKQHVLVATAPVGAVSVRVRASMIDGEFNIDLPHQASWYDDFSLTAVPEPTTALLGMFGFAMIGLVRRSR